MERDKSRSLQWGKSGRIITKNTILSTVPSESEGANGDVQLRQTKLGAKLFAKLSGKWHESSLSINGVTRIGTDLSNHLSISPDKIEFSKNSLNAITIDPSSGGATDGPLVRLRNSGTGYNRLFFQGANPEIYMGYSGSGASISGDNTTSKTGDINGSSQIFLNRETNGALSSVVFATAGTPNFALGGSESEFRIVKASGGSADIRVEANAGIRIDSNGDFGFRGAAPVAAPNYTATSQGIRNADAIFGDETMKDVVQTLIADLIVMGILQ